MSHGIDKIQGVPCSKSLISRTAEFDLGLTLPTRSSGVWAYELAAVTSAPHCNIARAYLSNIFIVKPLWRQKRTLSRLHNNWVGLKRHFTINTKADQAYYSFTKTEITSVNIAKAYAVIIIKKQTSQLAEHWRSYSRPKLGLQWPKFLAVT